MNTRKIAFQLLKGIYQQQDYSNLTLRKALNTLAEEQRPYVTQVVYGTIENFMLMRYCWEGYAKTLPKEELCILLDMSVYQLLKMDHVPAYAVVNEAVDIAKQTCSGSSGKFINAILRKVIEHGIPLMPKDADKALSIETSHPLWLIKMWKAQYGEEVCRKICQGNLRPRKNSARVNTLKIAKEELLKQEPLFQPSVISEDGVLYQGGNLAHTTYFQEGYVAMQDEASQLVAIWMDPKPQERILDVCSAPGTKACHIAQRMKDQGEILCGDIHEHRVSLIKEGAAKLGITCLQAQQMDARDLSGLADASFDRVLCDVPCSGYGTLSRKSDIKLHMRSSDMDTLIPLQQEILEEAAKKVKPCGTLVYSTCTLNKKENEKQIEKFLETHTEYSVEKQETIFPFIYDCDGFFIAVMKRDESSRSLHKLERGEQDVNKRNTK